MSVSEALVVGYANGMRAVVMSGSTTLSHKQHDFRGKL